MMFAAFIFWAAMAFVIYAYAFYPLLMAALARITPKPVRQCEDYPLAATVVIAAYNEAATIGRRICEFLTLLHATSPPGNLIVVSDGSTDRTAELARESAGERVRVIELPRNMGKAVALNAGCAAADNPILVFADSRQSWAPDALGKMLRNFADPSVGAVSGDLELRAESGVMGGVGLYWRYEKWLRRNEALVHSTVGATGAISAVRRELFQEIPGGTILDDVYWPLNVAMKGFRVVHEPQAKAFDRLPGNPRDEFRRKVRTLSANFQLARRLPRALNPWRNPIWFQFVSHKLARLIVPWALLAMLVCSAIAPGLFYRMAFWAQVALYVLGLLGLSKNVGKRLRIASAAGSFLVLNAAAWLGFWVWLTGRTGQSWKKVNYAHTNFCQ
jgi:poly-beta-1,6-N-acetyl-D-glucosamine synthase